MVYIALYLILSKYAEKTIIAPVYIFLWAGGIFLFDRILNFGVPNINNYLDTIGV